MDVFIRFKLFVFVVLCYFNEEVTTENNTANLSGMTDITATLESNTINDITTVLYAQTNGNEIPETTIEINKNENVTTEGNLVSEMVLPKMTENSTQKNFNTTEVNSNTEVSGIINMTTIEDIDADTTEQPADATHFSEVSFITVSDELTTAPTTLEKRDARTIYQSNRYIHNDISGKSRVTKESHWKDDDAIDRFAEEAQTVRVTSKVKDQNWLEKQDMLDFDPDRLKHFRFKTLVGSGGKTFTPNVRALSNHVYPTKSKESRYNINLQKTRFFDDNIIRPTHKVDRIKFHKDGHDENYSEKEKEIRQRTTNPKKVYSIGDVYRPQVLSLIEALPGNSRNDLLYGPASGVPRGYVNYQMPMSAERKIMKKFFRKIFETKSKSEAYPMKESLVYVSPDNNRGSKAYKKDTKETLGSISDLKEDYQSIMDDELFQKEKCELLKHVYITRSLDKKIANLERLFLKLFGVIMNGGNRFSKETIKIPKPTDDKQYYYVITGNNPQKRSVELLAEQPFKILNFVKVDCDELGNCGLRRFRKSVTNESSTIDKELHTTYNTNDVSKMLDALLNATNEAMNKFNATKYKEESSTFKDKEINVSHVAAYNEMNDNVTKTNKTEVKESVQSIQQVPEVQQVSTTPQVYQTTQKDFYPGKIGTYNDTHRRINKTALYKFKKHRFVPSPRTEDTLRKLKMLIHKYKLSENTFVSRLYESMKRSQKLNSTESTLAMQQDNYSTHTYVPQRRIYKNKYEMAKHSKQIMERLRMARDFAQTVQQQTRREKRQLKELTENQNHTLMLMDFLMDQDFPLEVTHEDDYVDFMTELVANAHYLKQPRKKTTTTKPKRKAPAYVQLSSSEEVTPPPKKKNVKRNIDYDEELNLAKDKVNEKEYHPAHDFKIPTDNH